MAKLLVNGEWYESVAPESLYEADFEGILLNNAGVLFPSYFACKFKRTVHSDVGSAAADLALIDLQYRRWWVVEVELGHHRLEDHVEPQVAALSGAAYGPAEAEHLARNAPTLDAGKLREMMRGVQPRVLVLVNEAKPAWSNRLARYDALVGVAELFRSRQNRSILRINGDQPDEMGDLVSECTVDPLLANFLVVHSPASLGGQGSERVLIRGEGGMSEWQRVESATRVWLTPLARSPLDPSTRAYRLLRAPDGQLVLKPQ